MKLTPCYISVIYRLLIAMLVHGKTNLVHEIGYIMHKQPPNSTIYMIFYRQITNLYSLKVISGVDKS